ncbi:hypothetical protein OJF2_59200 [Aquisphaera giovannonii]|uniref:DUF447 family protein n=1 Tax=Aquisphaera giovannonii TaxID=406548 RepID=A0A5B9WBS1_9BACT|nr:DUF447 domain-containing protein [Aquisphaera giovannonii]QEH37330.1 hypothetical protein OJF2_59200 [Aquisphaera giovannonii]
MIVEGIVTTVDGRGEVNIAPMGMTLGPDLDFAKFELRPYPSSTTFRNMRSQGAGVFHVTDDVLLLAQTAIGLTPTPAPRLAQAERIAGWVLLDCCRFYEFRVLGLDDSAARARVDVETLREGRLRDFLGFNRARHAVLEAAILATRTAFLPRQDILRDLEWLAVPVEKTGGAVERAAFDLLRDHVTRNAGVGPIVDGAGVP